MKKVINLLTFICPILAVALSAGIFFNRNAVRFPSGAKSNTLTGTYACGNGMLTAVIINEERSVIVLNNAGEQVSRVNADPWDSRSFSTAKYAALDEYNNLYILDVVFGGISGHNTERVLRYSEDGKFQEELSVLSYVNSDFLVTRGKIAGMSYYNGSIYLVILENDGFYFNQLPARSRGTVKTISFFKYPRALGDINSVNIDGENQRLTLTTKAGTILQYNFDGAVQYTKKAEQTLTLPWTAVSGKDGIVYADILSGEIILTDIQTGERTLLYKSSEEVPYCRLNYSGGMLFAAPINGASGIVRLSPGAKAETIGEYSYSKNRQMKYNLLFVACLLDMVLLLLAVFLFIRLFFHYCRNKRIQHIVLSGVCMGFGAILATTLIANEMSTRYEENVLAGLENVSHIMAAEIDGDVVASLWFPAQYDSKTYRTFQKSLKALFEETRFNGDIVYQTVKAVRNGKLYSVYDLENTYGLFFPLGPYSDDSYYKTVFDKGGNIDSGTGVKNWLFTAEPVFDKSGKITALIETGYGIAAVRNKTRQMLIRTLAILGGCIAAAATAGIILVVVAESVGKRKSR
jgi:hypothetical protein